MLDAVNPFDEISKLLVGIYFNNVYRMDYSSLNNHLSFLIKSFFPEGIIIVSVLTVFKDSLTDNRSLFL